MVVMLGIGASLGAVVRYFLTNLIKQHQRINFPFATLFLNISGAFLLGMLIGIKTTPTLYAVIGTGFLGGYTTFSTFNTELFALIHDKEYPGAILYAMISYVIGICCAFLGALVGNCL